MPALGHRYFAAAAATLFTDYLFIFNFIELYYILQYYLSLYLDADIRNIVTASKAPSAVTLYHFYRSLLSLGQSPYAKMLVITGSLPYYCHKRSCYYAGMTPR